MRRRSSAASSAPSTQLRKNFFKSFTIAQVQSFQEFFITVVDSFHVKKLS